MGLPIDHLSSRLPRRFPVGAKYVVEGYGGDVGNLRVIARYVVLPGGRRINVPADLCPAGIAAGAGFSAQPLILSDPRLIDIWHRYSPWQVGAARNQEERNMLRIMHHVCGPALPAALLLIGMTAMGITDAAAQGSPEARQACTPDAMRLCSEFTSDVSLTTKCMMAKRAQWGPECRAAMAHGTSHRAYRHYYRHYRHCTHGYCG